MVFRDEFLEQLWMHQRGLEATQYTLFYMLVFDELAVVASALVAGGSAAVFGLVHQGIRACAFVCLWANG